LSEPEAPTARGGILGRIHPAVLYSGGRVLVFAVLLGVLYLIGFRSWFLILGALLLSAPLSYFLLARQRNAFSERVEGRIGRRKDEKARLRAALAGEDDPA
jgi:hypothetical protein